MSRFKLAAIVGGGVLAMTALVPATAAMAAPTPTPQLTKTAFQLPSSLIVGQEDAQPIIVTVTDTTNPAIHPTGGFTVFGNAGILCSGTLNANGQGSCFLTPSELPAGTFFDVEADYFQPDSPFVPSGSEPATLVISQPTTQ